jgi:hypothetical protein
MSDFVTLTCPSCGGKLQITDDIDRFACAHCGSEHIVRRGGGVVSLAPVAEGLRQVQAGVDRTASELAIPRLEKEIADLRKQRDYAKGSVRAWGVFFVPAAIMGVGFVITSWVESALIVLGAAVIAVVVMLALLSRSIKEQASRTAEYDKRIRRKEEQLAKHRQIVDAEGIDKE